MKINEIEKMKHVMMDEDQNEIFENIGNPPFSRLNKINKPSIDSIWKDVMKKKPYYKKPQPVDVLKKIENKEDKNIVDVNLLNLIDSLV